MKLAYWMYAGPAHIGTLRVASSFKNVHAIMHGPIGDDYFNVMRSMLERERDFTPVTTSVVDRHVLARGSQDKVVQHITRKDNEDSPDLVLLTPTCTSSILQEDLQHFVDRASLESKCDVLLADVNHYRVNENQAADRTLAQIIKFYLETNTTRKKSEVPSINIIGAFTLGFHNQHDCRELKRIVNELNIEVNEIIPEGGSIQSIKNLPKAWVNVVPYREVGVMAAEYLKEKHAIPYIATTPIGIIDTNKFINELINLISNQGWNSTIDVSKYLDKQSRFVSQAAWFSRSIDCQNLTGKKVVVFGDTTHAASITRLLSREMGLRVSCAGTYCKNDADWFREQVQNYCDEVLVTEDHTQVADMISRIEPAAIFGTQMERHIGKRLGIPCGVISAPVHIQNFTLGYRPFFGYEGTNQIADLVYNSFTLGMEDHLLEIFGGHDTKEVITNSLSTDSELSWTVEAQKELKSIPGFVRNKIKRNTEKFARDKNFSKISIEVMYAAKEAFNN